MLFKSTTHLSSGEAYKYLSPTPIQRNLNVEPEPKNLWCFFESLVSLDAQQGCGITIPVISKTCFLS